MGLKVVILDGVLDSKCRKRKEQGGERGDWLEEGTAMNYIRSASPSASLRRHLGQINGKGLTETAALIGGGGRDQDTQGQRPGPTSFMENYDISTLLGTGTFTKVYRERYR